MSNVTIPMARALLTHMKKIGISPSSLTVTRDGDVSIKLTTGKGESDDVSADQLLEGWKLNHGSDKKTKRAQVPS